MIINGLAGKSLPVYGDGKNVRDWLYVEDHAKALALVLERGASAKATMSAAATSAPTFTWWRRFATSSTSWPRAPSGRGAA